MAFWGQVVWHADIFTSGAKLSEMQVCAGLIVWQVDFFTSGDELSGDEFS